jgi:hydrogenase nickel incorporation protein HypA/HybF
MHEMSIVLCILEAVEKRAIEVRGSLEKARVEKISMKVGAMSGVVPEALRFSFEVARIGTVFDGADLEIENVPLRARCRACGLEFAAEEAPFLCPACAGSDVEIASGRELFIESFELKDEEPVGDPS